MIDIKTRRLQLAHTWTISRDSTDYKDNVFVRIEKDGVTGIGEAAPNFRYGENAELTVQHLNAVAEKFETGDWWQYSEIKDMLDKFITDQSCAKCALDIALMDWVGKKLGIPLYRLWGLDKNKAPVTSYSIGIDTPEIITEKIQEATDYPLLKIKLGKDDDRIIMETVRAATDKRVRVDANEGWKDKHLALEKMQWLESLNVEFVEQPMPADMLEETAWLRERAGLPIVADEAVKNASDIPKLARAYDGINIKIMKSGGVQEALRMIGMARALNMKIMLGCMVESSVAITAAAHLSPLADWADLDGNLLLAEDPFYGVEVRNGKLILPEEPGLGVTENP